MAQRPVYIEFNAWTQITTAVDQEFTAQNRTTSDLMVFFKDTQPTVDTFHNDGSFEVKPGDPFQRPADAPLATHCYVKLANDNVDRNRKQVIPVTSA